MARGNPNFGKNNPHKFDNGREKPLSEQVKVLMYPETKTELQNLADENRCSVPDLVRMAIERYLQEVTKQKQAN